jgi:hypothetical protein
MLVPKFEGYNLENDRLMRYNDWIYVPPNYELRNFILNEDHRVVYMAHPEVMKMREDLNPLFLWKGMKKDIVNYVVRCLECQKVKAKHRHLAKLLHPHAIPESK